MKRIIALFMVGIIICCGLSSCGGGDSTVDMGETAESPRESQSEPIPADETEDEPDDQVFVDIRGDIVGMIRADQLGYRRVGTKHAVIADENAQSFEIARADDGLVVYRGELSAPVMCTSSDETVRIADFSVLEDEGEYFIAVDGGRSHSFLIADLPYGGLRLAVLEMFNYQKCGVAIEYGIWSHPECHIEEAVTYETEETKDVSGGWHDAGDYGRYIVPAAKSVADLLYAYELGAVRDDNLLETVWFNVEWMLKMQDETTGGVYHKVTTRSFPAMDLSPENDRNPLVLSPISPTATADFAASMALASRFYPDEAQRLLDASKRAWQWCLDNPDAPGFKNPPRISTGEYGDTNSRDSQLWAAAELFSATKDEEYHDYLKAHSTSLGVGFGWRETGSYSLVAYLFGASEYADADLYKKMKDRFLSECEEIMKRFTQSPYGESLGNSFPWGSNMNVANNAVHLMLGAKLDDKPEYVEAAAAHMNYLLGFNALGRGFITGFTPTAPLYPHHRPSVAAGAAVPGMVVGGPEGNLSDPVLKEACEGLPVAKRYIDHVDSYASNEITIYWNSPVYFLLALLGI